MASSSLSKGCGSNPKVCKELHGLQTAASANPHRFTSPQGPNSNSPNTYAQVWVHPRSSSKGQPLSRNLSSTVSSNKQPSTDFCFTSSSGCSLTGSPSSSSLANLTANPIGVPGANTVCQAQLNQTRCHPKGKEPQTMGKTTPRICPSQDRNADALSSAANQDNSQTGISRAAQTNQATEVLSKEALGKKTFKAREGLENVMTKVAFICLMLTFVLSTPVEHSKFVFVIVLMLSPILLKHYPTLPLS